MTEEVKYWKEPFPKGKKQLQKSANNFRKDDFNERDLHLINSYRQSHSLVLMNFKRIINYRIKKFKNVQRCRIEVGQRLKIKETLLDKLKRFPKMDICRMHDLAGIRVIFPNEEDMRLFLSRNKELSKHIFEREYDYIDSAKNGPKETGYRGIHRIYKHNVKGNIWNGLLIEMQFRTVYQHAWATAVEVSDFIKDERIKFSSGKEKTDRENFFFYASEIIARGLEKKDPSEQFQNVSNRELVRKFFYYNKKTEMMDTFAGVQAVSTSGKIKKDDYVLIVFNKERSKVDFIPSSDKTELLNQWNKLEEDKDLEGCKIIFLEKMDKKSIRDVYRNYFCDTRLFREYLIKSLSKLRERSRNEKSN